MPIKVTITDLKNIKSLKFELPQPGAYLLTGSNGSGKTSLLTCLSRLRHSGAFQRGFRSSKNRFLDSHRGASIQYEINGDSVTYTYVEERWAPLPRKNSRLLKTCGYPEVAYIAADADRIEPQREEFSPRRIKPTAQALRDAMNAIFSTSRFSELCYLNIHRGGANQAYLIRQPQPGKATHYFSERNFSLGELCVLKLLLALEDIPDDSLVLIDELELAIHPRAQMQLFHYLTEFSKQKNLTIIFSTHSVTLIKGTDRRQILFLQNSNGMVNCHRGCYPTFALGHITSGEEVAPDCVVYVEDDSAKKCVTAMLDIFREKMLTKNVALPTTLVVPLGGFSQILEFLDKAPQMLPNHTKLVAMLDDDVRIESLVSYKEENNHAMLALFEKLKGSLFYLPWTPEVGLVQLIRNYIPSHESLLKEYFSDNRISIADDWAKELDKKTGKELRKYCKKEINKLSSYLAKLLGKSNDRIREDLFRYLVLQTKNNSTHDLTGLISKAIL